MNTKDTAASPSSLQSLPKLEGGLILTGRVIAVRTEDKEWESKKYTQTTISISDGQQVFLMKHRHDDQPWTAPALFAQVEVKVTRATTEKGQITVSGVFEK